MTENLSNLAPVNDEVENDVLGSSGPVPVPSAVYDAEIKMAYIIKSRGGAKGIRFHFVDPVGILDHEETLYVTSGDAKGNKHTYIGKDGKEQTLPGLLTADALCYLATGKPLREQVVEDKTIKIYDYDARKEIPTEVPVITSLLKKDIKLGILQVRENKRVQKGNKWVDSNEERLTNQVAKFFSPKGLTISEMKAGQAEPSFMNSWAEKNNDRLVDNYKPVKSEATAGAPGAVGDSEKPSEDLFA